MVHDVDGWRNGSASDSSPEGYGFDSRAVHLFFFLNFFYFLFRGRVDGGDAQEGERGRGALAHGEIVGRVRFTPADTTGMGRKTFTLNGGNLRVVSRETSSSASSATPRHLSAFLYFKEL